MADYSKGMHLDFVGYGRPYPALLIERLDDGRWLVEKKIHGKTRRTKVSEKTLRSEYVPIAAPPPEDRNGEE